MKIRERDDVEFKSTLDGDQTAMTIDVAAMSHIMGLLSDLYKYPILAVLREYSTNAWDAHIEAGVPVPIEVNLPSQLNHTLRIRDYGVGLSKWEIENVYAQYGKSTKRDTDDLNGMLGLGCKSAFAYAPMFTIVSVKDGWGCRVSISKDGDAAGVVTAEEPFETDEPNGTQVIIPTKKDDQHKFAHWAQHLYSYWPEGTVKLNGEFPKQFEGERVTDQFHIIKSRNSSYVVMGNVPYEVPNHEINHGLASGYALVAFTPIGSVDIPPHRETLKDTPYTQETVKALGDDFREAIFKIAQEDVDAADNRRQAMKRRRKWVNKVSGIRMDSFTYKGETFPEIADFGEHNKYVFAYRQNGRKLTYHDKGTKMDPETLVDGIFFSGYAKGKFTPTDRKKLDLWLSTRREQIGDWSGFVLTEHGVLNKWIPNERQFNWEDVVALKLPRPVKTRSGNLSGSYEVYASSAWDRYSHWKDFYGNEILDHPNVFFTDAGTAIASTYSAKFDKAFGKDEWVLVNMTGNRLDKFQREHPSARPVLTVYNDLRREWIKTVPEDIKLALKYRDDLGGFNQLDPYYLEDNDLTNAILAARRTDIDDWVKQARSWRYDLAYDVPAPEGQINFRERYPMVHAIWHHSSYMFRRRLPDLVDYVNAMYFTTVKD